MTPKPPLSDQNSLAVIAKVKTDSLIPCQQPTPRKKLISSDCYQQRFLKYQDIANCHSYAEFIYAILMEFNPDVHSFVPKPFNLLVLGRHYVPDFYVVSKQGREIIKVTGQAGMKPEMHYAVSSFFEWNDLKFSVISDECVLALESRALNWLPILQVLVDADRRGIDTTAQEYRIYQQIIEESLMVIGDLLQSSRRDEQHLEEVALYRLFHKNRISVDIDKAPLDFDTEVKVWDSPGESDLLNNLS